MMLLSNKKFWVVSLVVLLTGLLLVPSIGSSQNQTYYLALGDNMVRSQSEDGSQYVDLLSQEMKDGKGGFFVNLTGNYSGMAALGQWLETNRIPGKSFPQTRLIILTVGTQELADYLTGVTGEDFSQFKLKYERNLDHMLLNLNKNSKAKVVINDLYNPYPRKHKQWKQTQLQVAELNKMIYQKAWQYQVSVAPVQETFADGAGKKVHKYVGSDLLPNQDGHHAFAQAYGRVIKQYISE